MYLFSDLNFLDASLRKHYKLTIKKDAAVKSYRQSKSLELILLVIDCSIPWNKPILTEITKKSEKLFKDGTEITLKDILIINESDLDNINKNTRQMLSTHVLKFIRGYNCGTCGVRLLSEAISKVVKTGIIYCNKNTFLNL